MENDGPENFEEALKALEEARKDLHSHKTDRIILAIFFAVTLILLGSVAIKKMMTDYDFRKFRAEAVQKGYAEFKIDQSYSPSFSWKEEIQKKEDSK